MTPTERFTAWRGEIEVEIAAAEAELAAARAALSDAEAVAKAKRAEIEELVERARRAAGLKGTPHADGTVRVKDEGLANVISARLNDVVRLEKRQAEGAAAQAKECVKHLEFRLENLREGLQQAMRATDPAPQAAAPVDPGAKPVTEEPVNGWPT